MPVLGAPEWTEAAINDVLAQTSPTRLLIVNQGIETEFRERLERIAEQYPDRVFVWSHVPSLPSLAATWNRALHLVWETGGTEALVVNNDVRLHKYTYYLLSWYRQRTDALFVTAVGVTAEQFNPDLDYAYEENDKSLHSRGGPDFSCFLISKEGHEKYPFDENFSPAYCEDLDLHRRYMLGGDGEKIFSINLPYLHYGSGTLKSMTPEQKSSLERRIGQSRAYYEKKWGGSVNHERFTIPFDAETDQDGVTTPELQRAILQSV